MTTVRDAATVMLLRDAPGGGIEVFMLRRNPLSVFTPNAYVYPGGGVDPADAGVVHTGGRDDFDRVLDHPAAHRFWVAAARECFEEAGFLLTDPAPVHDHADDRDALNDRTLDFGAFLAANGYTVTADRMHVFAHWRTPLGAPRRYDTWFFVAAAPDGQVGMHDDAEAVDSEWMRPEDALRRWVADDIELILPTQRTLRACAGFGDTASLLAAVRANEAEARAAGQTPLVIDEAPAGQRIALDAAERALASRGWRELESDFSADMAIEAADRAAIERGVA